MSCNKRCLLHFTFFSHSLLFQFYARIIWPEISLNVNVPTRYAPSKREIDKFQHTMRMRNVPCEHWTVKQNEAMKHWIEYTYRVRCSFEDIFFSLVEWSNYSALVCQKPQTGPLGSSSWTHGSLCSPELNLCCSRARSQTTNVRPLKLFKMFSGELLLFCIFDEWFADMVHSLTHGK